MKPGLAATLLAVVLVPVPAFALDCSCTAPDNSCSTSVSCPAGCSAICGTGGKCKSYCAGSGDWAEENQNLKVAPGKGTPTGVTFSAKGLTSLDLAEILSDHFNISISFVPADPTETYNIDISNMPPGQLLQALSEFGAVAIVGQGSSSHHEESIRRAIPSASVSLRLPKTTAGEVAAILSELLGGSPLKLTTSEPNEPLSIDINHMDLASVIQGLHATSSIRVERVEP